MSGVSAWGGWRSLVFAFLGAFVGVLSTSLARAERVAVAPPKVSGRNADSLRDGFRASLTGGLASAGHDVITVAEVDNALRDTPAIATCDTDVCLAKLGQLLVARALLRSAIELLGSSNYSFHVELFDVRAGHVSAIIDDTCSICTVREANEALSRAAASLGAKIASQRSSEPVAPAAIVPVAPTITTSAVRRTRRAWTPRARLLTGLGAGALVLGAGAVAGGAALIAIDGSTEQVIPGGMQAPYQSTTHTLIPGIVLTAAGGLFIAGAGVLFWRGDRARTR